MNIFALPVEDFLLQAASAEPTPGGGGVAALAGALGASMVSMVANLTTGRERFREVEERVTELRAEAEFLMKEFQRLAQADVEAFSQLMAAFRLPKTTDEERTGRALAISTAARAATDVPLAVAENALKTLGAARSVAEIGNENAASDAGVAACMAEAAVTAALLNVDINLPLVGDDEYRSAAVTVRDKMLAEAAALRDEVLQVVKKKIR